jgi:hypothetical protein
VDHKLGLVELISIVLVERPEHFYSFPAFCCPSRSVNVALDHSEPASFLKHQLPPK